MGTMAIGLAGCPGPSSESKASGAFGPLGVVPVRCGLLGGPLIPESPTPVVPPGVAAAAFDAGCGAVDSAGISLESLHGLKASALARGVGLGFVKSELAGPTGDPAPAELRGPGWVAGCASNSGACPAGS